MKHPLEETWTLWYLKWSNTKPWEECLVEVGSFSTVEDFWSFYNHLKSLSLFKRGSNFSMFKSGIRPMWEDSANRNGGRWLINVDKNLAPRKLDQYWMELAMCMIGEQFVGLNHLICGATINLRAGGHRIGLWLRDSNNENGQVVQIGLLIKKLLGFGPDQVIKFQTHVDVQNQDELGEIETTYSV